MTFQQDLGDGLVLRQATLADAQRIIDFNGEVHRMPGAEGTDEGIMVLTRDLILGEHPTCGAADFTLVEDSNSGAIVSTMNLIPQTWSYGGVQFAAGRPELVGTHKDYRRRGLVRAQFELIHRCSDERGHKLQAITGIPYFYRQFGYEMALELGGGRIGYKPQVVVLKEGEKEAYSLRPAREADLPFIARLVEQADERYLVACVRDDELWRYELDGRSDKNGDQRELRIVETAEGEAVGFLVHGIKLWQKRMNAPVYELKPGVSWAAVTPAVIRYLWATGEQYAKLEGQEMTSFAFWLGSAHPVYDVIPTHLPHVRKTYAWFMRVADLPGFLVHVAPGLERRLAASVLAGHSGELKISFYRSGLRLLFDQGCLTEATSWQPKFAEDGDAFFPDLAFLQLLFGYRTLVELDHSFADCFADNDAARALLNILFPRQPSHVWPLV